MGLNHHSRICWDETRVDGKTAPLGYGSLCCASFTGFCFFNKQLVLPSEWGPSSVSLLVNGKAYSSLAFSYISGPIPF